MPLHFSHNSVEYLPLVYIFNSHTFQVISNRWIIWEMWNVRYLL